MVTRLWGGPGLPDSFRILLDTYGEFIYPGVFLGFFIFAAIAVVRKGRYRRAFVVTGLCLLLITSQLGVTLLPFIHAQRYSPVDGQEDRTHAIVLVDGAGNEIVLDQRSSTPYSSRSLGSNLVSEWDDTTRLKVAEEILQDGNQYRSQVEGTFPRLYHPPSSAGVIWNRGDLEAIGVFESIRVYEVEWVYESGSHAVATTSERCLLEISPYSETIDRRCSDV